MIGESPSELEKKFRDLAEVVVAEAGYQLYDMEYVKAGKTLRVYICDKSTGSALIEDCVSVDRAFTPFVEEADWIPDDFVLEVSSPGVYRNLKSEDHFKSALGEYVLIGTSTPLQDESLPKKVKGGKKVRGILKEYDNKKIILSVEGKQLEINLQDIKKATLDPDL